MRLLVIATNQEKFPYAVVPVGACRIANYLSKNKHEVEFVDLMFCKNINKKVKKALKKVMPEAVLISIRNIDNGVLISPIFYLKTVKYLISVVRKISVRKISDIKVIIGGTGFSSEPKEIFEYLKPDFGITGEGEESVKALLENYQDYNKISGIPGLVFQKDGTILQNPVRFSYEIAVNQAESLIFADVKKYLSNGSFPGIQTRSGCPRNCIYCDGFKMSGRRYRCIAPEKIIKELDAVKRKWKTDKFYFLDEIFSEPLDYAKLLLKEIIKSRINIRFEICDAPACIDPEYVYLLKKAGCAGIMSSIDSGSGAMLKSLKKGFTKEDIIKTAELYSKYEIPYFLTLLLGAPGENFKTLKEGFNFIKQLPGTSAVLLNYGIRIQSETEIFKYSDKSTNNQELLYPKFFLSGKIKKPEWNLIYKECKENSGWATYSKLDRFLIIKSLKYLQYFLPYPQWQYAGKISVFLQPLKRLIELFVKEYKYEDLLEMQNIIRD